MLIYFDKQPMGMKVGSEGEPLIHSWTTKFIKERIAKEETLELVDPISDRFPEASYRHPFSIAAYHDLKKYFVKQMQLIDVMDGALMGDVPETCTRSPSKRKASTKRKNRNEDDVEMGDVHMDVEDFPSTSTVNQKKVRHGVDVEDMDGSRMSGLLFAQEMPLYSPDHVMADVLQHAQHVEIQENIVQLEKEESHKQEVGTCRDYVVKIDGGKIHLSHDMLHEEFKPTGHMSTMGDDDDDRMVDETRKGKGPNQRRGPSSDTTHNNLLNFDKVQDQKVIEDPVDAKILGYDVAMCNMASFTVYFF
ncbi:uncharacterized protein LOC131323730 [Rhododendron vialii]|uniref:uncharacterized protein LOC131323730 n=1 Tax=Rhododendron vialii TaxID=182163 RepID=UPI00265F032E|nr:uncharacterized protein LOC131323730 [Rhododendron vialii]